MSSKIFSFHFCFVDTKKFIIDCSNHHLNRRLQLAPRLLETTNAVRVENLPPGVDDYQLQLYFENPSNGGGRVARVECFPEESSALVEFCDSKGNVSWPAAQHSLHGWPFQRFLKPECVCLFICQKRHQSFIHLDLVQKEGSKTRPGEADERQGRESLW